MSIHNNKKNSKLRYKYGGNPLVTIDPLSLGNYEELEPSLSSSGLELTAGIANRVINESNFIVKDTVTSTFETILTESPTGLIAAASSGVVKIAGLSLGFIVSAAIIVVAKFYMVLRNNSFAYRNALVIIYEFYETLFRLFNLLDYIEQVSAKLDPPFVLDSGEIYQDIKNIFQVMDLITTSTMFKNINITAAKGERFYLTDDSDQTLLMPDNPSWTAKFKSKIKSWTFDETDWNNKMNTAIGRFNTHMIMLITEWKIIAELRSTHLSREIVEERKTLLPIKCMIRRIILAPLIRIRNIMYACALSSQTELCLNHANSDKPILFKIDKFKENMKRLWNKMNDGGTADFKKILTLLKIEIDKIKVKPDYTNNDYYIEEAVKVFIDELHSNLSIILVQSEDISLKQYQTIYENVEAIYNYAQNCNLTESLHDIIKDTPTHRRYKAAAENSVQKRIIIGISEQEKAQALIHRYSIFYLNLLQKCNILEEIIINISGQQLKGFLFTKIPYNSYFITVKSREYKAMLETIILELHFIYGRMNTLYNHIKDDISIERTIKENVFIELNYSLGRYNIFNDYLSQCDILNQNLIDIDNQINRYRRVQDLTRVRQLESDKLKLTNDFQSIKASIELSVNQYIKNDFIITNRIISNLILFRLDKNIQTNDQYWYFEDIPTYYTIFKAIIEQGSNTLFNIEFIEKLKNLLLLFTFILHLLTSLISLDQTILSSYTSLDKGNMMAGYLLLGFFINNGIIYFKTEQYYENINQKLLFFIQHIIENYGQINDRSHQHRKREYINYNKGFLCTIEEVRIFEKIKKMNDYMNQCGYITSNQYILFNTHLAQSQYGGRYKSKKLASKNKKSRYFIKS